SVLISIMMVVVVPKVTSIFASLDRALPWYTSLLITVSSAIGSSEMLGIVVMIVTITLSRRALRIGTAKGAARSPAAAVFATAALGLLVTFGFVVESVSAYAIGLGAGLAIALLLARLLNYIATPAGKIRKDGLMLRIPIFGQLLRMLAVARFSRTLATLLQSGVPLLKAMDIVKNVLDNGKLEKVIETATGSIREGESIAGPLKRSGDFPPIVTHMIAVGERSGQLEQMLENVARAYDTQVETRVAALTSLLEPLMIVVMGGGVGFIAFAILMPLIQMNEFVQQ
ncbi:MAG: type II secretion system F family protein, partial [Polyangiaceae bacterium]